MTRSSNTSQSPPVYFSICCSLHVLASVSLSLLDGSFLNHFFFFGPQCKTYVVYCFVVLVLGFALHILIFNHFRFQKGFKESTERSCLPITINRTPGFTSVALISSQILSFCSRTPSKTLHCI